MSVYGGPKLITSGLVLDLDAANAKSYPGSGTTWSDLSGNGNNGTLTNGPTFDANNAGSIVFDGVNDYIDGPLISSQFTGDMTAEAWIKLTNSSSDYVRIIGTGAAVGNRTFGLWYDTGNKLLWQRYGGGDPSIYPNTPTMTTNTWCHTVATTSGTSHALYLNGVSIGTGSGTGPWAASGSTITVGYGTIHTYHKGNISNVKLYNRGLSATEVLQNFNALRGRYGI